MNHDFSTRTNFCRWVVLVALAFVSIGGNAQTVVYDRFTTASGIEVLTGPGYIPKTVDQARGQAIWNGAVNSSGGLPEVVGNHVARNPSGNPVAVVTKASIPSAELGKAVGRSIGRIASKVAVPIVVGMELYDLAKELGFILGRNTDGSLKVEKQDPLICSVAPCFEYAMSAAAVTTYYPTVSQACQSAIGHYLYNNYVMGTMAVYTGGACDYTTSTGSTYSGGLSSRSVAPSSGLTSASQQEFVDAVAAKSGWPSTSAINSVVKKDLEAGSVVKTGAITVSGPATSSGTQRVTNNTTNNTTRTDTTTHNHAYSGDTVTTTNVYNSVVINNTTGGTVSNETTTETGSVDPAKDDQCSLHPDSLGCSELGDQEETPMPKKTENVTFTPVAFQSNATCPAPLSITGTLPISGSFNYSLSYSGVCDGAGIVRLFLLAGAALVGVGIFVGGLKT